ncbi:MAG TPA: hypothetical protein VNT75_19110 [Symbiobacteriaceae bacterium]|nr:hypothetical protein [Symbiobacteriaceae bacterium]
MSVSRLEHLLETGQFRRCLEEALALLAAGCKTTAERVRTCAAVCRCRLELGDWREAASAGLEALSLAQADSDPDTLGAVLADLGTAQLRLRQYAPALFHWRRYLRLLPRLAGARCREGAVRMQMAGVLHRLGRPARALAAYAAARRWFDRFGDERSGWACARAMVSICLETGDLGRAAALLEEGDRCLDAESQVDHLLDWARYRLAAGLPAEGAELAFGALELAEGLEQQGNAQMVLAHAAVQQARPVEALAFALAARVSAMEGSLYSLEFDASELIFRLLRQHGRDLMDEVAADFKQQGVDIYEYLSERAIRRVVT